MLSFSVSDYFYIQLFSSLFMTGLIWFVQIVHYPLFAYIEPSHFPHYAKKHQRLTSWVVGPVMLLEVFSAMILTVKYNVLWLNILLIMGIWLSTAFLQIPLHGQLSHHYDINNIHSLTNGNWIRTILWTVKSIVLLFAIVDFI
ncbi:MAG TPA: hypothetical protein PKC21_00435 [Oligoflexia bacterium]|nr:hypothetical protein [Oligoflexia bacterium]HMR23794.1 hypothetical protein [Oligoflexia bacterium]